MATLTKNPEKIADQQDRERRRLELIGLRSARSLGRRLRAAAVGAFNRGDDLLQAINPILEDITELLVGNMTAAHLVGRRRAIISAGHVVGTRSLAFAAKDAYVGAVKFTQDRLNLSKDDIKIIANNYGPRAVEITRNLGVVVERAAQDAVGVMVERGAHTREGIEILRKQLDKAGLTNVQPYLLETIARTQTQLAYGAGRWNANQDPAIDEILWGYEYVTVGDDRVRPNHEALNGTRYPKNDSMLQEIWPPNGFNCRCTMVEIYFEGTPNRPGEIEVVDGMEVVPGADKGWAFNPGVVHADGLRLRGKDFKPIIPKIKKRITPRMVKPKLKPKAKPKAKPEVLAEPKPGLSSQKWAQSLDSTESRLVDWWGGSGHDSIRAFQSGKKIPGPASKKEMADRVKVLEKALDKAATHEGTVFRGLNGLNQAAFDAIKNAKTIKMEALSSSSRSRKIATSFTRKDDPRAILFEIKSKTGVNLESVLGHLKEQEVVLRKGSKYAVRSTSAEVVEGRKVLRVVLEEIKS